jgi:uncharacterized protein YecE (DUF72 family)
MSTILIGTCGYYYKEWAGPVYPVGTKQAALLGLYAGMFPTVEIDNTYYGMPTAQTMAKKLVDGGPSLTFSIKAYKTLTHERNPATWAADVKAYREGLTPVLEAGRLEKVLFQFPYSFHYEDDNRRYLAKLLDYFKDVPCAVEFRGADWFTESVFEALRDRGISLVSLDMPELPGLPPLTELVTAKTAYVRLHGRQKEAWWGSDKWAQFNYLYKDQELEAWVDRIRRIMGQADRLLVYFNNHPNGHAVKNAHTLTKMLGKAGILTEAAVKDRSDGKQGSGDLPL